MRATEILKSEHRVIEAMLNCLEELARQSELTAFLDDASAREVLDFLATFADRCHHGKEEDLLFRALEARGLSASGGPTGVMRSEHELGRTLLAAMRASVDDGPERDRASVRRFVAAAREYVVLLREHIQKEDHCLFSMADQLLSADEQVALTSRFLAFEGGPEMAGAHERCLAIADRLTRRFGVHTPHVAGAAACGHACKAPALAG